jgi:predicted acetyltransferase
MAFYLRSSVSLTREPRGDLPETLRFRFAKPDEIPEVARLITHSFPGLGRSVENWTEQLADPIYGGGAETLVIGAESGRIVAAHQIHPMEQWVTGSPLAMSGVGTVTVAPTHRRRGVAAKLMKAGLELAAERGDQASALYPFRHSFYQQSGFGAAGQAHQFQVPPSSLPDSDLRHNVEIAGPGAVREELLDYYMKWVRTQTGQLTRTPRTLAKICDVPDRGVFVYRANNVIEGYAIATYRTDLPRRDRYLDVDELVWSNDNARRGLTGWLSTLGDQWDLITLRTLPSHRMSDWVREPRLPHNAAPLWLLWAPAATLMMGPMFRLVDAASAFSKRATADGAPLRIDLQVTDKQLAKNDGAWRLDIADGSATLDRTKSGTADASITLDISALSRLYIGSLRATDAATAGLLTCDRTERLPALDALLAVPEPWTFDRF